MYLDNTENLMNTAATQEYDASQIQVLEGLEAVRKRPGMYIGSTGERGLHHLVYEIVDNAIDEALAGFCDHIEVDILDGDVIRVRDNGRGIPVGIQEKTGLPAVTVVFTILHAGGKFGGGGYKVSGGLHGVGSSVVNALSSYLEVEVRDGAHVYYQRFEQGAAVCDLKIIGDTTERGTTVTFKADPEIFTETTHYDYDILLTRLREQSFLNAGIKVTLTDKRENLEPHEKDKDGNNRSDILHYEGGIKSYCEFLLGKKRAERLFDDVIYVSAAANDIQAEIALLYNTGYDNTIISFANNMHTIDGGTHESAFKTSLTRTINAYARKFKMLKDNDANFKGEDCQEGLIAVISVKLTDAQFESQTKAKLGNTAAGTLVSNAMSGAFTDYLEDNPSVAKLIVNKVMSASTAREKAQKARELERSKSTGTKMRMPDKLHDCISRDATRTELYIVEGDSAGGSAIKGRDSQFQAILPLWGKMLNVEKARIDKVYGNEKLTPVVIALGTGIGENFDITKLRYDKIVIMADADVDGAHIQTLLMTFFFRYMPELIEQGHIYLAMPPLFEVKKGKQKRYAFTEAERDMYSAELGSNCTIQRYKGLGEMDPEQLWETTMDPAFRQMKRVDMASAEKADEVFSILMGDDVDPRRKFIEENAQYVEDLDI
ncbi:MAG: DNA topoisomerase (ATP-hydrolyzing) subunit B [Acutalibacteraceae bacterium]